MGVVWVFVCLYFEIYKIFLNGIEEGNTTHAHTRRGLSLLDEET